MVPANGRQGIIGNLTGPAAFMNNIEASVIVCVYNRGTEVQGCLDSLLAMDHQDFEIVLVDDASTDDTPRQLEAFRETHPDKPITITRNERNLGVSGARNAGLRVARGEFVFFTDSDCIVDRGWLTTLLHVLSTTNAAAVGGAAVNPSPTNLAERAYVGQTRITQSRWQSRRIAGGNMGFRRDIAVRYQFDEALNYYCDEEDMAWRLQSEGHAVINVPEAVVHHHHHLNLRGYLSMARRQGAGSARYWYKTGTYVGRDLWAGFAALVTLPLAILDLRLLVIPALLALLQVAAIAFNEMALKGKGFGETLYILPVCLLYQSHKAWGVVTTWGRMLLGGERAIRESKRKWWNRTGSAAG